MPGIAGQNGYNSTVIVANTAGTQVNLCGAGPASSAGVAAAQGVLHSVSFGGDTTAETLTIYDGTSTGGVVRFKAVAPANALQTLILDIQFTVGMFVVLSGGTAPAVTLAWA